MIGSTRSRLLVLLGVGLAVTLACSFRAEARPVAPGIQAKPAEIHVANGPIPIRVLVQSPADTSTELQVICLFQSDPSNTLHGSLTEIDEKLKGLLGRIRTPALFRGELGETILVVPPVGTLAAGKLMIIGLGDSQTFTPQRMELVGSIVYREANRLGVAHPFFAPTVLDGGVTKFTTGEVSEQVVSGFLRALRAEKSAQRCRSVAGTSDSGPHLPGRAHPRRRYTAGNRKGDCWRCWKTAGRVVRADPWVGLGPFGCAQGRRGKPRPYNT